MGKISKTGNLINTINDILIQAKNREILHLYTEDEFLNGRQITLKGKQLINFGSCSYMGLEFDQRIINAGIDALKRYGSQYSSSRTYVSFTLYKELEEHLSMVFQAPVLLTTSTTMGHLGVIPIVVDDNDAVILDQQAHFSMKDAVDKIKLRDVTVEMIRHSHLDELESKIIALNNKHDKIWYFIDGIYSMYGDAAPITDLMGLLEKYEKLHLYIDDAHGMSWAGKHGSGFVLSKIKLHPRMILAGSLAKGFASAGGIFVFPDEKLRDKVRNWGGPLGYSGPQQPAVVGASLASVKIHLSDEIGDLQQSLAQKIKYCNDALKRHNLPHVAESIGPIFYIGLGLTKVGYSMVRNLADDGFYVNLGIFPAVPETCTGIRFTLTNHLTFKDIDNLVERLAWHLPKVLNEEGRDMEDIYRAFRHLNRFKKTDGVLTKKVSPDLKFNLQHETTIKAIPEGSWNLFLGDRGMFDWRGMEFLEKSFQNNELPEHNWKFHYYIIRDRFDRVILATYFTEAIVKDDVFATDAVSRQIEIQRKENKYYLTSKSLTMGSFATEGHHLYLDKTSSEWKDALIYLLDTIWKLQEANSINSLFLRDFDAGDIEVRDLLMDHGFIKIQLPDAFILEDLNWQSREEWLYKLPKKKRNIIRKEAIKFEDDFEVTFVTNPTEKDIKNWYKLYENIFHKNLTLNAFKVPFKLLENIANDTSCWEILQLKLVSKNDQPGENLPVGVVFIYVSKNNYCPLLIGMDYDYVIKFNIYRQILFQIALRASKLNKQKVYLGFTADEEKKKFGAISTPTVAYVQMKDNYNMSVIEQFTNIKKT